MKLNNFLIATGLLASSLVYATGSASPNIEKRSQMSSYVLDEWQTAPEGIPTSLFKASECVMVFPEVLKAGFVIGGRLGKGMASCRTATGWSNPIFYEVYGASFGLLAGIESSDLVLVYTRDNAAHRLSGNNFTLGGGADITVGPIGRNLQAGTDWKLESQIYSFARSRGLYAGLSLEGATIALDSKANFKAYGDSFNAYTQLTSPAVMTNYSEDFVTALGKVAP